MAAMVKLLDEKFGIKAGFMTTIHAYTGTQMLLDGPRGTKTGRNLRAAAINTIAHSTGAAKAIGKVVPSVNGYNDEGIVSSDILGDTHGGVFDPTQTDVNTIDGVTLARTVSFYDNEYGFTSNMIRTLLYFAEISE